MPTILPISLPKKLGSKTLIGLMIAFFLITGGAIILAVRASEQARIKYAENQAKQFAAPDTALKRQVHRIEVERGEGDNKQYIEILANGRVNVYDAKHKLLKSGLRGFAEINNLLDAVNRNLDNLGAVFGGKGTYTVTVDTNQGTTTTTIPENPGGGGGSGGIGDDIDDIGDEILNPTPPPSPQPTIPPGSPTPPPSGGNPPTPPPGSGNPFATPTPDPGIGPTPLPPYMTAPPFTCDQYYTGGKPKKISNVICGPQ